MRKFSRARVAAVLLLGLTPAITPPAIAHHAFSAEFDSAKSVELSGVITKFVLTNPHSWLYLDVTGPDGKVTNWGFEFGTPFALHSRGITKKTFPVGTRVTIQGFRAKSGKAFGYATSTVLEDGKRFSTGGAPDAPAPR